MKRRLWVPLVAVGLAALILVPTTFAVGEPGTTLFARLGTNRFPAGQGAADASLTFNSERDIVLRIQILGPANTVNAVRVYVDGTCSNPGEWVINRTSNAGFNGPFLTVNSNTGVNTIQVNQFDVDRIRSELAENPNETFALMVARLINGQNYRTCTTFQTTPFPPLTTTTTTTSPTTTAPTTTGNTTRVSTVFSTGTTVSTITSAGTPTIITLTNETSVGTSTGFSTGFSTGLSTGLSTGFATTVSTGATTTATLTVPVTTVPVTTVPVTTVPVTTVPVTTVTTTSVGSQTVTLPVVTSFSTVTRTFTTPVTTVTLVL